MHRAPIWHSLAEVPADLGPTAVTVGNFDGVHRGHRYVLQTLRTAAQERGLAPLALTFWPHPRHVMHGPGDPALLTSHEDRDRLLLLDGVAGVLDLPFTWDFAQHSAEDFARIFLVEGLGARLLVMGRDSRFGRGNTGGAEEMREIGARLGFEVLVMPDLGEDAIPGGDEGRAGIARISSSAIRQAMLAGDIPAATSMLGRFPTVSDVVHHGHKRGRLLGFPTANLGPDPAGLVPADGVYAGWITVIEQAPEHTGTPPLLGAPTTISIGTNPTFETGGHPVRTVEAYVHGAHDLDLYGDTVRLEFVERQRPTLRFDSAEALVAQMERDKDVTRRTLEQAAPDGAQPR